MPRKQRNPKVRRVIDLDPVQAYVFEHGVIPPCDEREDYPGNVFAAYMTTHPSLSGPCERFKRFRALWLEHRDAFLEDWISERPGTRPFAWWLVDAPRGQHDGTPSRGPEPLRHVGGSGQPNPEGVYAEALAKSAGCLPFEDVDPMDPPLVESAAAYLRRHGLLLPGERHRLMAEDFEPVEIDYSDGAVDDDNNGGDQV